MITFADDHEAARWWDCVKAILSAVYNNRETYNVAEEAALFADDAVLEYRKRCGPGAIPESVDSFIRQAVNFADKVGSHTQNVATRQSATSIIQNGERLLAEGDDR